jgi:hypothetical protein
MVLNNFGLNMSGLLVALGGVASIVNLVCLILVLIKLFKVKGVLWGIFGIICGIYTFIWGWQNVESQNIKNVMLVWSAAFVVSLLVRVLAMTTAGAEA